MSVWLCSLLLILNVLSFIPQIREIHRTKSEAKTPTTLLYFGTMSAIQQLVLCHHFSLEKNSFRMTVQDPDGWMHLFYPTAAWIFFSNILIIADVYYSTITLFKKWKFVSLVLFCEFMSLRPLFQGNHERAMDFSVLGIFSAVWQMNPAILCVTIYYLFSHLDEGERADSPSILTVIGLVSQILIHILLPISWLRLFRFPLEVFMKVPMKGKLTTYRIFGWALVDNLVFACFQGWFLWMALKERADLAVAIPRYNELSEKRSFFRSLGPGHSPEFEFKLDGKPDSN